MKDAEKLGGGKEKEAEDEEWELSEKRRIGGSGGLSF